MQKDGGIPGWQPYLHLRVSSPDEGNIPDVFNETAYSKKPHNEKAIFSSPSRRSSL